MRCVVLALLVFASFGSVARADSPRIAIVVSGDPSSRLVAAATELEATLVTQGEVTLPADAAVRDALRGAEGTSDDGLDELRGRRRRLGLASGGDHSTLDLIGEQLELVVVVVVSGAESPVARVYDVNEHRWFVGEAALDEASREASASFVGARAAAAARRRLAPPPEATAATSVPATTESATSAPQGATEPAPEPHRRSFMARNWPFFVAGALLVGTTTFFLVQRGNRDTSPPVIHIRPGGN